MSARVETMPRGLVVGVLVMMLVVLGLGGAVIAIKLRPQALPTTAVDRSVALWEDEVAKHPESADAHTGLGLALLDAAKQDDARNEFETAIGLDDAAWMAKLQLGLLLKDTDPKRAVELIGGAAKAAPEESRIAPLIALGDVLLAQNDAEGARDAYRRSIAYNPFTFDAHYGLGQAFEALGDPVGALKEYKEAKRFEPTNQDVNDAIARLQG